MQKQNAKGEFMQQEDAHKDVNCNENQFYKISMKRNHFGDSGFQVLKGRFMRNRAACQ